MLIKDNENAIFDGSVRPPALVTAQSQVLVDSTMRDESDLADKYGRSQAKQRKQKSSARLSDKRDTKGSKQQKFKKQNSGNM